MQRKQAMMEEKIFQYFILNFSFSLPPPEAKILTAQHARGDKKSLPEDNNNELMRTMENVN